MCPLLKCWNKKFGKRGTINKIFFGIRKKRFRDKEAFIDETLAVQW